MEKDKIKRFVEVHIPVTTCNLKCHYCYITQLGLWKKRGADFKYPIEVIRKGLSVERLGGKCMMNLCGGGETLIPPETLEIARAFLEEGHYVTIVTNGTISRRFDELKSFPAELLERLFFKFSFQYLELKRLNLLDRWIENVKKVRALGCSIAIEITPNDELIPYIDEIKELSMREFKALPHITIARVDAKPGVPMLTNLSKEEFSKTWGQFDSEMLKFKLPVFGQKRKEFCYAGDWSFCINLGTGIASKCYKGACMGNIFDDINKPINFEAIGCRCPLPHCYNAHSFLLWGDIPNFTKTTYADIRNRICTDNTEWLNSKMKEFMSSKLTEANKEYSVFRKMKMSGSNLLQQADKVSKKLFSIEKVRNSEGVKTHKIIKICGVKIKLKKKSQKKNKAKEKVTKTEELLNNLITLTELQRLDSFVKEVAPKDQMIFVCLNGVGDCMLYASYWRELEEMYKTKIFWVVTKAHEIVLKMYGITNYLALDYIGAHKKGKFSGALNVSTTPVKNIPFYAHWTYNMATRVAKDYFLDFVRDAMDLKGKPLNHPVWYPEITKELSEKISSIKDLSKTVLISPDARWLPINDNRLWNDIANELTAQGYEIIVNDYLHAIKFDNDYCTPELSTEELVALSQKCLATISPRSGFTDIVHELGEKLFVLYTDEGMFNLFTLNKLCSTKNVNEYIYSAEFSPKYISCAIKKYEDKKRADILKEAKSA